MNKLILFTAGAWFLVGCSTTPNWDKKFGDSARAASAKQMINPAASSNTDPVNGMDGKAAASATGRYHDSFNKEPPPPVILFGK